jgi:hypothetical protein
MPTALTRATAQLTDDDGTGTTGTVYNAAWYTLLCNMIDAIFSAAARASVFNSTTQSLTNATWTTVTFDSEEIDSGSLHSNSSNTSRITIPSGADGTYLVTATIPFVANATGGRGVRFQKNGTTVVGTAAWGAAFSASGAGPQVQASLLITLAAGDYVEAQAFQDSTGSLNIGNASTRYLQSQFAAVRIV